MLNRGNRSSNVLVESSILGFQGKEIGWLSARISIRGNYFSNCLQFGQVMSVQVGGHGWAARNWWVLYGLFNITYPNCWTEYCCGSQSEPFLTFLICKESEDLRIKFMMGYLCYFFCIVVKAMVFPLQVCNHVIK
jgi:hypothetical protein